MTIYSLLFPGQGSQSVGMGKDLYTQFAAAKAIFDEADDILDFGLSGICFEGPDSILDDTANTQPAIFVTSYALLKTLEGELGHPLQPMAMAGHSLGEFTALVASGALSFKEGLKLVQRRGALMKSAGEKNAGGMMAVIGSDLPAITKLIENISLDTKEVLKIANDNCPGQVVISGSPIALKEFEACYKESGVKFVKKLSVSVACHTSLMSEAQKEFDRDLEYTEINPAKVDVIANTTAKPIREPQEIRTELLNQLSGQVSWTQTISFLNQCGCTLFLEIGPGKVLCGLAKRILPNSECASIGSVAQLTSALQLLRDWEK